MTRPKLYPNKVAGHNRWICIGLSCFNQLQGESAARLEYGAFFISGPREDACVVDLVLDAKGNNALTKRPEADQGYEGAGARRQVDSNQPTESPTNALKRTRAMKALPNNWKPRYEEAGAKRQIGSEWDCAIGLETGCCNHDRTDSITLFHPIFNGNYPRTWRAWLVHMESPYILWRIEVIIEVISARNYSRHELRLTSPADSPETLVIGYWRNSFNQVAGDSYEVQERHSGQYDAKLGCKYPIANLCQLPMSKVQRPDIQSQSWQNEQNDANRMGPSNSDARLSSNTWTTMAS
ncbi:uncharacterized protein EURHEDRAFT_544355 [Aspergillus ruber CBS 135680]|uniref:Uncharacterized protein n=1 Tax=Aspergillus ruber (strain CBS 135680) TaxID=1388766 RepID=A0A017S7C0_ASPRC|nr:uncharacterized protein EURHEDRAFT_544355 [Aspergillus ruber CBS 135680]EYE92030.1 hypothetical protein EURHEDRAFT_544355 [Aspergillus ruber CBS 135680]